jgi:hypothetical protein
MSSSAGKKDLIARFLTVFGDIKIFKGPLFFLYDPGSYLVKGEDMREVIKVVEPGDILLRGYTNYLDGRFIPGYFSHVGFYLGPVYREQLASGWSDENTPLDQLKGLKTGEQMVIHSMAEGVFMEDLLNFCRCDYMAIFRFPPELKATNDPPLSVYDPDKYNNAERKIEARLAQGETVQFNEAWPTIRNLALSQLDKSYDFRFDFRSFDSFSCSELVYYSAKAFCWHLGIEPTTKKALYFFKKNMLEPDVYACCDKLKLVWQSKSVSKERIAEMRKTAAAAV